MERIKMTFGQFSAYLRDLKGCQFISVISMTDADMYLRNNPFRGRVKKVTFTPMQFNYDYETAVNNRLEREGKERSFSADHLKWGVWVEGMRNKVITHKGGLYLRTYCVKGATPRSFYLLDGHLASAEEYEQFASFLKPESVSAKQCEAGLDESDHVKPRTYGFGSLIAVTINHTRIYLVDDEE